MINNSEDANKYYNVVNQYIDEYVDKWKIKPTNLKNYLLGNKSKLINFLERRGLKDVNNIDRVVLDIVEDRVSMHSDSVMTFENFKFFESEEFKVLHLKDCLYKGIEKATINHEKVLADYFDVSLSQISAISPEKHTFLIHDIDSPIVIYSEDELTVIKENIIEYSYQQMFKKIISLDLSTSKFELKMGDFISENQFKDKFSLYLSNEKIQEVVSSLLYAKILTSGEKSPLFSDFVIYQLL